MPKILAPDVLPNNFKMIREMRRLNINEAAEGLKIDRNFLSAVESNNKNFSGKKTIEALKYYNITFNKAYDVKETLTLATTDDFPFKTLKKTFVFNDINDINNINQVQLKNHIAISLNELEFSEFEYKVIDKKLNENILHIDTEITLKRKETRNIEYKINFLEELNVPLATMLQYRGYPDVVTEIERVVDNVNVYITGNEVYLGKEYKIPLDANQKNVDKFEVRDRLNLNDPRLELKIIEENKPGQTLKTQIIKFKAIRPEINNLKAIRTLTNMQIEEMHEALGLTYNGYINLELGNQKISTKVMWRLVKLLKIPFELIINVDEYYDKYCLYNKKIIKKSNDLEE